MTTQSFPGENPIEKTAFLLAREERFFRGKSDMITKRDIRFSVTECPERTAIEITGSLKYTVGQAMAITATQEEVDTERNRMADAVMRKLYGAALGKADECRRLVRRLALEVQETGVIQLGSVDKAFDELRSLLSGGDAEIDSTYRPHDEPEPCVQSGASHRIMTSKPGTVFTCKYGGADCTVEELASVIVPMLQIDGKDVTDQWCERFEIKDTLEAGR